MFVMDTNVHSGLHLCRLCYPYLKESEQASVIFNSSVAGGPTALKSGVVYAMTKGPPAQTMVPFLIPRQPLNRIISIHPESVSTSPVTALHLSCRVGLLLLAIGRLENRATPSAQSQHL